MKKLFLLFIYCLIWKSAISQSKLYFEKQYAADSLFAEKQYLAAGKAYSLVLDNDKSVYRPYDYINAIAAYSLAKQPNQAFRYLNYMAYEKNYSNHESLIKDSYLTFIKGDLRWQVLISRVKANYEKASKHYNQKLKAELEIIYENDQKFRRLLDPAIQKHGIHSTQVANIEAKMAETDKINLKKVSAIINTHGWLGPKSVGDKAAQALFIVVQHADTDPELQFRFLKKFEIAISKGIVNNNEDYAMLLDRVSLYKYKYQVYGSQLRLGNDNIFTPLPIKDSTHVDERRIQMGLTPLKYYIKLNNLYFKKQ